MTNEKEIWKAVENYEDLYEVSNLGRVRSLDKLIWVVPSHTKPYYQKRSGKLLKPTKKLNGILEVNLHCEMNTKTFILARLVASAFLPKSVKTAYILHKDGNKDNCRADNLAWVDFEHSGKFLGHQTRNKKVRHIETGKIYSSARQASRELHFSESYVCQAITKNIFSDGYHFEYIKEELKDD